SSLSWSMPSTTNWLANYFSLPPLGSDPGSTSTTTYTYDKNGNLTQSTTGATTTTYAYDYANRLIGLRSTGDAATTTYGYDALGARVFQKTGSTTTVYPNKFFSQIFTTAGATTTATSTEYAFAGDTLLATIDTPSTTVGTTTTAGTSTTHYIHPDNLGSTQASSDAQGNLSQYFLYNPYGSLITSTSTDAGNIKRQYIGQYTDPSGLSYLNARYYASERGQFLSQDPL
ncbi:MAG TPA: RHS repeat-associated core domain-containing protein, partial [Candidatus Paceibacterota bacterium]